VRCGDYPQVAFRRKLRREESNLREQTVSESPSTEPELLPGRYRHFKGKEYRVFGVARDSETMRPMVVYQTLYGDFSWWVRPLEMFTEIIERDGRRVRRFEFVAAE
jgi:hypothetical protein